MVRYVPLGKYFARLRVAGKLIRKSLKTDVLLIVNLFQSPAHKLTAR